jgi:hypothetical protein
MSAILGSLRTLTAGFNPIRQVAKPAKVLANVGHNVDRFHKTAGSKHIRHSSDSGSKQIKQSQDLSDLGYSKKYLIDDEAGNAVILDEERMMLDAFRKEVKASEKAAAKSGN